MYSYTNTANFCDIGLLVTHPFQDGRTGLLSSFLFPCALRAELKTGSVGGQMGRKSIAGWWLSPTILVGEYTWLTMVNINIEYTVNNG